MLYLAQKFGYRIEQIPVKVSYEGNSKINVVRDSLKMLRELLQIRRNDAAGRYNIQDETPTLKAKR